MALALALPPLAMAAPIAAPARIPAPAQSVTSPPAVHPDLPLAVPVPVPVPTRAVSTPPREHKPLHIGEIARRARHLNGGGRVLAVHAKPDGYHVKLIKHGEVRIVIVPHP
ncbi:MAG TPA: hypothetical protein VFQ88_02750 [Nevskiaceae bacterium]|nr:hypothetical protein [Nevskiaceae bacterium]